MKFHKATDEIEDACKERIRQWFAFEAGLTSCYLRVQIWRGWARGGACDSVVKDADVSARDFGNSLDCYVNEVRDVLAPRTW